MPFILSTLPSLLSELFDYNILTMLLRQLVLKSLSVYFRGAKASCDTLMNGFFDKFLDLCFDTRTRVSSNAPVFEFESAFQFVLL
jgi:hypothetical protein